MKKVYFIKKSIKLKKYVAQVLGEDLVKNAWFLSSDMFYLKRAIASKDANCFSTGTDIVVELVNGNFVKFSVKGYKAFDKFTLKECQEI